MGNQGDKDHPSGGEQQDNASEVAARKEDRTPAPERKPNSAPPPHDRPRHKQHYRCWYLLSQFLLVAVAIGGVGIAICSLRSLDRSVRAATRQASAAAVEAQTAQRQLELSERPWLSVTAAVVGPLVFDSHGAHIAVAFWLRNWGRSPATHMSLWGELTIPKVLDPLEPIKVQYGMCEGMRRASVRNPHGKRLGISVFPTNTIKLKEIFEATPTQVATGHQLKDFPGKTSRYIWPQVVGCVMYHFGAETYWTGFRYEIFNKNPGKPDLPGGIIPQGSVPTSDLVFAESDGGNDAH